VGDLLKLIELLLENDWIKFSSQIFYMMMKQLPSKPIHHWKALDELFPKLCSELQTEAMVLVYVKKNVWQFSLRNTVDLEL
jgi:hypothetical protein